MHLTPEETTALEAAFPPLADLTLQRMRARLNRWELMHLREHAAQLVIKLDDAEQRAHSAEEAANFWREQVMQMQQDLAEDLCVGITRDGSLSVQPRAGR